MATYSKLFASVSIIHFPRCSQADTQIGSICPLFDVFFFYIPCWKQNKDIFQMGYHKEENASTQELIC